MPDKRWRKNTPASKKLEALKKAGACAEALEYLKTSATVMDLGVNIPADKPEWAVWDLTVFGKDEEVAIRKVMIAKIKEPMMAFRMYLDLDFLTTDEDKMLEDIFKGKLPRAEKELADGVTARAKNG